MSTPCSRFEGNLNEWHDKLNDDSQQEDEINNTVDTSIEQVNFVNISKPVPAHMSQEEA